MKKEKSWVDKQMENPRIKKMVEEELINLAISEELIKLRLEAHLTQAQVAKKMGTTASAISRYEKSDYCKHDLKTISKYALACGQRMNVYFEPVSAKRSLKTKKGF
jgi:transcriptional regulator with XRE-family HTH domain